MLNFLIATMRDFLRPRRDLLLENLALRQQILLLRSEEHTSDIQSRITLSYAGFCL